MTTNKINSKILFDKSEVIDELNLVKQILDAGDTCSRSFERGACYSNLKKWY